MALADRRIVVRAVLAVVLVSAVGLSACGRKGALEPPPGPSATVSEDGAQSEDAKKNKSNKPNRPFFLDPLL
ncbi:MAG TPA: lipoprotein [Bauldia sp.]|nr:lipoprotein [Bauldia sp.]